MSKTTAYIIAEKIQERCEKWKAEGVTWHAVDIAPIIEEYAPSTSEKYIFDKTKMQKTNHSEDLRREHEKDIAAKDAEIDALRSWAAEVNTEVDKLGPLIEAEARAIDLAEKALKGLIFLRDNETNEIVVSSDASHPAHLECQCCYYDVYDDANIHADDCALSEALSAIAALKTDSQKGGDAPCPTKPQYSEGSDAPAAGPAQEAIAAMKGGA